MNETCGVPDGVIMQMSELVYDGLCFGNMIAKINRENTEPIVDADFLQKRETVEILKEEDGFALKMVKYHWVYDPMSEPYLIHNCGPDEWRVNHTTYLHIDVSDKVACIYCHKLYPKSIYTAAILLNARIPDRMFP